MTANNQLQSPSAAELLPSAQMSKYLDLTPSAPFDPIRSILPARGSLLQEALENAVEFDVEGTPARVFTAEHLAAIALQTGRAKDKARLLQFIESGAIDATRLEAILNRHQLAQGWQRFQRQFLGDTP